MLDPPRPDPVPLPFGIDQLIIRADVHIVGIDPPITRTLELPLRMNLAELHHVLQAAFGWTDSHLHQFNIGGLAYGAPEHDEGYEDERRTFEATEVRLRDFVIRNDAPLRLLYEYDFGDSWMHELSLTLVPRETDANYPRCTGGSRSGPPEDAGGAGSYDELLDTWRDPAHPEHKHIRRWTGRKFDPERFDLAATNKAISTAMRKARGDYVFRRL